MVEMNERTKKKKSHQVGQEIEDAEGEREDVDEGSWQERR